MSGSRIVWLSLAVVSGSLAVGCLEPESDNPDFIEADRFRMVSAWQACEILRHLFMTGRSLR